MPSTAGATTETGPHSIAQETQMIPAVQQLVLGSATLGLTGARQDAYALLDSFVELGGSIIDTAAVYNDWVPGETRRSETIIGEWLRTRPRGTAPFICTKGAHPPLSDMGHARLDEDSIVGDVEESLRRLGVERLDLFYLHRDDVGRPVEDILHTLARLRQQGKIDSIGLSNWTMPRVEAARRTGIVPISSNQVLGNVLCRRMGPLADPTVIVLDAAALHDAEASQSSLFLFSSQCGGYLGKRGKADGPPEYRTPEAEVAAAAMVALAAHHGQDPTALAVAFLLAFSPRVFPVIGSRSLEQLRRSMAARNVVLDTEIVAEIARISGFAAWRA
jgi:aryl-alcohol dehydrogenase-like predicted oxidoreductase